MEFTLQDLSRFIVTAKATTYVGNGQKATPCRPGAQDLRFTGGDWAYHDSYFGSADFLGQEVVYFRGRPVWAMNYYGRILAPEAITAAEAGGMIKRSLSRMYGEGRFLGGFTHAHEDLTYTDTSEGDPACFRGVEWIERSGRRVYELMYHGGLVRD